MKDQERKVFERFLPPALRGWIYPFKYYVFWSKHKEPSEKERREGVYLVECAEAEYLKKFFDPLYGSAGIGICTSDDEIISGDKLVFLANAITLAIEDVKLQPREWPVLIGYKLEPFQEEPSEPIVKMATQEKLLEFLEKVVYIIQQAKEANGYVSFGGGG